MKIVSAADLTGTPKVLLYGQPGVGKSILAAQAPRPTLLLDFDYGAKRSLVRTLEDLGVETRGLDVVREPVLEEVDQLASSLYAGRKTRYRSIVIDSLTELQMQHRTLSLGDRLRATREDYGLNVEWVRRVVRNLCHSEITVVFTCLQDEHEGDTGIWIAPALTPSLLRSVEAFVDSIVYLTSRTMEQNNQVVVERLALTANMENIRAKDRDGLLPLRVKNPTWKTLFGTLEADNAAAISARAAADVTADAATMDPAPEGDEL